MLLSGDADMNEKVKDQITWMQCWFPTHVEGKFVWIYITVHIYAIWTDVDDKILKTYLIKFFT